MTPFRILMLLAFIPILGCDVEPKESQGIKYCLMEGNSYSLCCNRRSYIGNSVDLFDCSNGIAHIINATNIIETK